MKANWTRILMATAVAASVWSGQAWGATIQSAGSGYWDVGATWGSSMPTADDDVTIQSGHTITNRGLETRYASNLTIQAGGVLTHLTNNAAEVHKLVLSIGSNLTVAAGGAINVDGRGYYKQQGPGFGTHAAAHGGRAGVSDTAGHSAGTTYGSITAPTNCGSGGHSQYGDYGGGAAILTVGGLSTVDGLISAVAVSSSYYAGSGGSVFLRTGSLTGSGTLRADGGAVINGGAGGGGRVAVVLTQSTDFSGVRVTAYGGKAGNLLSHGAPGTVYLEKQGDTANQGKLIVDGDDQLPVDEARLALWTTWQNGKDPSSYAFSEIVLTNGAFYMLDTNDVLDIANTALRVDPSSRFDGIYLYGGTLKVPSADLTVSNYFIRIAHTNSTFDPALTSLTVGTNADLRIDVPWTAAHALTLDPGGILTFNAPVVLNTSLTIPAGGVLTHAAHDIGDTVEKYKVTLRTVSNLTIAAGGEINVDGRGYNKTRGPGYAGYAAGHGGRGGVATVGGHAPGLTYGSVTAPTNCGSGGNTSYGNSGGGVALLAVGGTCAVHGVISAGCVGPVGHYAGSGGSVYLTTGKLTGSGTVRADGGSVSGGGGGGGGRVAAIVTNATDFGEVTMSAYGGSSASASPGAPGTVYRERSGDGAGGGVLIVDAKNQSPADTNRLALWLTMFDNKVTNTAVGTVIITNKASLAISNITLTVQGDWENKATFLSQANGTVVFAGTNAVVVKGTNTFENLVSTNAGKTIRFEDGRTNAVAGVLTLLNATVDSMSGVGPWYLKASALTHNVSNVTAGRSDAWPGSQITAYESTDLGGNSNWVFVSSGSQVNTWTGTTDTDWTKAANWSQNRTTIETDDVVIPGGCPFYPLLDSTRRLKSLTIANTASMGLAGHDLTVDEDLASAGMLSAAGVETLTLRGNVDFSGGGTFNPASSTVWLVGADTQTVVSAGNAFNNVIVSNSAAPLVFTDALTAANVVNLAAPLTFGGSVTVVSLLRTSGANVSFAGAVTAGALDNRNGALVFSGTVTVATFTNWAGDLTFRDDVSAVGFYSAPGGMTHTFKDGKTVTVANLEWYGRHGYPIVLRSSADGTAWNLNVTNGAKVRQVDVRDSDASAGQTIRPVASTNSGNNLNWDFGGPWLTWVGTVSDSFTNAGNWAPAGIPDGSSHLLIDGYAANAPVLSGVATVAQVIVGSVTTATLTVNGTLTTLEDVEILSNGTMTHSPNGSLETNRLHLVVGSNLTVNGAINVDSRGYAGGQGPGYIAEARGGSYGGQAGKYDATNPVGPTYGSITAPTNCGSGGYVYYGDPSHAGGGAVRLEVAGMTTLSGLISASGMDGFYYRGSGGSVFLTTGSLAGSGTVKATGGSYDGGACGGGGRIAVILTGSTDFGDVRMQTYGGNSSVMVRRGAAGTVYRQHKDQAAGHGVLLVDNNVVADASSTTLISDKVTDAVVGTVIITNQAMLKIDTDCSLTANGDWLNAATFMATNAGATVILGSSNAATIRANNTFQNLVATNAGKTLSFEAGRTNTVNGLLKFGVTGPVPLLTLQSTTPGSQWYLTLTTGVGTQEIRKVSVQDSNASGGQTLLAGKGSVDGKNNLNWEFQKAGGTVFIVR